MTKYYLNSYKNLIFYNNNSTLFTIFLSICLAILTIYWTFLAPISNPLTSVSLNLTTDLLENLPEDLSLDSIKPNQVQEVIEVSNNQKTNWFITKEDLILLGVALVIFGVTYYLGGNGDAGTEVTKFTNDDLNINIDNPIEEKPLENTKKTIYFSIFLGVAYVVLSYLTS